MMRDAKLFQRNSGRIPPSEGSENLDMSKPLQNPDSDPSRPPLNAIQEPSQNPRMPPRTPSKSRLPLRTPEKPLASAKNRFGWAGSNGGAESSDLLPPLARGLSLGTPRANRTVGKASSVVSDCSSVQSTPTKSVSKPGLGGSRAAAMRSRAMNFMVATKGLPMSSPAPQVYAAAEVPHFGLREDPSFWMDHNVQVVIRVRPLNSTERSLQGYSRCLKQDSAHSITWIGQPETRFTFDYVACETITQEMLFRVAGLPMVENCMSGYNSCMFAYGQTGSGKTYTMLGDIDELELRPSTERGMTPRIFEFLFARIRAEEESRRDEKLKYNCKCSFLEIYNEQISDLLDPSSTNLLLREDSRKGVYVDNLTEYEVETVHDILKLLFQGAANRRVAATNMNHESSRSHSVFTCVIESKWEKDSTTNLRFARLNLVDLAGSERQKTSGAEGERLKEAANINKSLSTLGHVIMVLADLANGKQRHVPYRDSRLTFLLQDSLGGNSKTMIIANVSPSVCSTNETLSTLKFAQRARLVQNNAVVNEDTSGDVISLQHQIRLLKEELLVLKRHNVSRSLSFCEEIEDSKDEECDSMDELHGDESSHSVRVSAEQLKSLEALLTGALRREKTADTTIKQLEAEIEQLNRLVRQREEDTRCSKMMLKFREDKIHRMEALLDGLLPPDSYLLEESNTLKEEMQLFRERVDRNPEVTRFALENIRLLDQLRRFQDFYEEGERELLLTEVSELRNQLMQVFHGKYEDHPPNPDMNPQEAEHLKFAGSKDIESLNIELKSTCQELEDCRNKLNSCLETNARLSRELSSLHTVLTTIKPAGHVQHVNVESEDMELCLDWLHSGHLPYSTDHAEENLNLQLELDILKTILGEEKSSRIEAEERAFLADSKLEEANKSFLHISKHNEDIENELKDTKSVIEALESQQILSLNELEELRESNNKLVELLKKKEQKIFVLRKQLGVRSDMDEELQSASGIQKERSLKHPKIEDSPLQEKLKRMQDSLEKARNLNSRFLNDEASQTSIEQEKDEVRRQVEVETTEVIVCLQEELTTLQQQVDDNTKNELLAKESILTLEIEIKELNKKLTLVTEENERLSGMLERKEQSIRSLSEDWGRLAYEIAEVLDDGNLALEDASDQASFISDSFPDSNWVTEKVGKMIRSISEKDLLIEELQKCMEDAQSLKCDLEWKLRSLRGSTLAISEAQRLESSDKERHILQLTSQIAEKMSIITELENSQMLIQVESEKQIQALEAQLEQSQEQNADLLKQIELSQEQAQALGQQLKAVQESVIFPGDDILEGKMKLNTPHAYMNECVEEVGCATDECFGIADCDSEHRTAVDLNKDTVNDKQFHTQCESSGSTCNTAARKGSNFKRGVLSEDILNREPAIFLLRVELESALDSLKGVQAQMVKLLDEKEELKLQSQKNIENMTVEVARLKLEIIDKEEQCQLRLLELEAELEAIKDNTMASNVCWHKVKEGLELEISDAKAIAAQKTIEASILLTKFEEAQETMQDADMTVNELMMANEIAKHEVERHKKSETKLSLEWSRLTGELHALQSCLDERGQEYKSMEKNFQLNLRETRSLVSELEDAFRLVQSTFTEKFNLITDDLHEVKSQLHQHVQFARDSLEEIWSEIIGKDCAVFVSHICHKEILLERITDLAAENGVLYSVLCESNSVVADLREQNLIAKKEVERCNILKEKLLVDINSSSSRIAKKEDEATEFKARLNSFEDKIMHLQLQEESMLDRSRSMASEFALIMKDLDANNRNTSIAISEQEKIRKENEELHDLLEKKTKLLTEANFINIILTGFLYKDLNMLVFDSRLESSMKFNDLTVCSMTVDKVSELCKSSRSQIESVMINMFANDFELLVMASEMEQKTEEFNLMALQKLGLESQLDALREVIDRINKEFVLNKLDMELINNEANSLRVENEKLNNELVEVKEANLRAVEDLQEAKMAFATSHEHASIIIEENHKLQDMISSSEACIARLQTEINRKYAEQDVILKEFESNNEVNEIQRQRIDSVEMENDSLRNELVALKSKTGDELVILGSKIRHCCDLALTLNSIIDRVIHITDGEVIFMIDRMYQEICNYKDKSSKFVDELELFELSIKELNSHNSSLQTEIMRKDEVSRGLSFDLSLLQESASIAKDQNDKLAVILESVEQELLAKSCELDDAVASGGLLETQLLEKNLRIDELEFKISEINNALKLVSAENLELKAHAENILDTRNAIEKELTEKIKVTERLENEVLDMGGLIGQRNHLLKDLQSDLTKLTDERDHLDSEVHFLRKQMEMAQALAEEQEAIATEARQIAEERKTYASDLEEENKLLERSVEELECTVNVLENKVEFIKEEAEGLRLQREESEMELEAVRHQILMIPASGSTWDVKGGRNLDMARYLKEKVTELQEAQENIQILQKEVAEKDAEIAQCKEHISELNMHAEAQAREYKLKFKELEAMAQQVKVDTTSSNSANLATVKSEKGVAKSRGSGSPFKCIGLGLVQQMSSERGEELTAANHRIQELEALAATRQKEVFMLNTRLAAAESMTHDVIRDLLGIKMDMTNCASFLNLHQDQHINENAPYDGQQYREKDQELAKLNKQLNQFVEERESWLDQINQRHTEMVAAQIELEKLRQREQFLTTENEMLKVANSKNKTFIIELEDEVKKLSDQQNLQQRIHHHAKIKEENSFLRVQNGDLNKKLKRSDAALSRVKEELARYRAASGKKQYVDIDEEERLRRKLDDSEEERNQLAEQLLSLCTNILKAAGLSPASYSMSPSTAEEALYQLKARINSLECEVQDLKVKCKIFYERIHLAEIKKHISSPMSNNCLSPVSGGSPHTYQYEAVETEDERREIC